jgi:hypothetical protein
MEQKRTEAAVADHRDEPLGKEPGEPICALKEHWQRRQHGKLADSSGRDFIDDAKADPPEQRKDEQRTRQRKPALEKALSASVPAHTDTSHEQWQVQRQSEVNCTVRHATGEKRDRGNSCPKNESSGRPEGVEKQGSYEIEEADHLHEPEGAWRAASQDIQEEEPLQHHLRRREACQQASQRRKNVHGVDSTQPPEIE